MPSPLSLTKADIVKLKQLRVFSDADVVLHGLLLGKTAGNATQTVSASAFFTEWNIDDDTLARNLATFELRKLLKLTVAPFVITWAGSPTTSLTEAELREKRTMGVIDDYTSYVYYSLLLRKTAAAEQTVDPALMLSDWSIPQTNLIAEVNRLAGKDPAPFTVNYPSLEVIWLETIGNA